MQAARVEPDRVLHFTDHLVSESACHYHLDPVYIRDGCTTGSEVMWQEMSIPGTGIDICTVTVHRMRQWRDW